MDNTSSLNATEIAVGSLLANRGGGYGGGGGAWGGGMPGYAPFASPGSNAVRLNRNAQLIEDQADCTRMMFGAGLDRVSDQAEESRRSAQFTTLVDSVNGNTNRVTDNQFRSELRNSDQIAAITREIAQNARFADKCCCDTQKAIADAARESAKCCCDAQLLATKNACDTQLRIAESESRIIAEIKASESRGIERDRNLLQSELIALRTQVACGCTTGCSTPCNGRWTEHGCPDQPGEMVTMCYNDETITVPQDAVNTMKAQGATCGSCDERCCPDQPGKKIDMCLNGNTINVSRNACKGILNAGGTCGPCETIEVEPIVNSATTKKK